MFKYLIGPEGREVYKTLPFDNIEEKRTVTDLINAFDIYCRPKKIETVERFKFNMRVQGDEILEKYITDLKTLAMTCNFGELQDSLIRDRIVCGVKDTHLRERLLRTQELTLDKAIEIVRAVEVTKQSLSALNRSSNQTVHKVKPEFKGKPNYVKGTQNPATNNKVCIYYGKLHEMKKEHCPAYGKRCSKCKGPNPFSLMCESLKQNKRRYTPRGSAGKQRVHVVDDKQSDYYELLSIQEEFTCNSVKSSGEIFAALDICGKRTNFQIDSGATCNIIPKQLVPSSVNMEPTNSILKMSNKTTVNPIGKCQLEVHNPKTCTIHTANFSSL